MVPEKVLIASLAPENLPFLLFIQGTFLIKSANLDNRILIELLLLLNPKHRLPIFILATLSIQHMRIPLCYLVQNTLIR